MYQKAGERRKRLPENKEFKDLGCKEATWFLRLTTHNPKARSSCLECPFYQCILDLDRRKGEIPVPKELFDEDN